MQPIEWVKEKQLSTKGTGSHRQIQHLCRRRWPHWENPQRSMGWNAPASIRSAPLQCSWCEDTLRYYPHRIKRSNAEDVKLAFLSDLWCLQWKWHHLVLKTLRPPLKWQHTDVRNTRVRRSGKCMGYSLGLFFIVNLKLFLYWSQSWGIWEEMHLPTFTRATCANWKLHPSFILRSALPPSVTEKKKKKLLILFFSIFYLLLK